MNQMRGESFRADAERGDIRIKQKAVISWALALNRSTAHEPHAQSLRHTVQISSSEK